MNLKDKPLKLFFILFALVLFLGITGSVLLRSYNEKKYPERFVNDVENVNEGYDKSFPQIVNAPSRSVEVGELFTFTPRVAPASDAVVLSILEAPDWLVFDGSVVSGTPQKKETVSFVIRVEKDGRYIDQEFFLVVIDDTDE
jgi:hypothetical protein